MISSCSHLAANWLNTRIVSASFHCDEEWTQSVDVMASVPCILTEQSLVDLTGRLRSHVGWIRSRAAAELRETDFEEFERPPRTSLLLAALNAPALRDRARD